MHNRDVLSVISNTLKMGVGGNRSNKGKHFGDQKGGGKECKQLVSTKILATKRLEAHEKAAVKYFSSRKMEKCWSELKQCDDILKEYRETRDNRDNNLAEHQLYVLYLYAEFTYKVGSMHECRMYIAKAKAQPRSSPYMDHINVLDICLLIHTQQYEQVLHRIHQFELTELSGKLRRRLCFATSTAYMEMHLYADAERVLQTEENRLANDDSLAPQQQQTELHKLIVKRVECLVAQKKNTAAIHLLRGAIKTAKQAVSSEIALAYVDTLIRQGLILEGIVFSEAWLAQATTNQVEMTLRLFRLYYEIGDYDSAVERLADVAEPQFLSYYKSQDYEALGEIKHFQGADKEAEKLLVKAIEMTEDPNRKCRLYVTLLGYELSGSVRAGRQEELSELMKGVSETGAVSVYREYIESQMNRNRQ